MQPSISGELNGIVNAIEQFNDAASAWNGHLEQMESLASDLEMAQQEIEASLPMIRGLVDAMEKVEEQVLPDLESIDEIDFEPGL